MMCGGCGARIAGTESLCRECREQLMTGATAWDCSLDDYSEWIECWNCAGEGLSDHDCGEDTCCCIDPEPNVPCDICEGAGG